MNQTSKKSLPVRVCERIARRLGYQLVPLLRSHLRSEIPAGAKLYVGCGEDQLADYVGCDIRPLEHVALACKSWEISSFCNGLSEIYSRHMVEHLTQAEARLTFADWYKALAPGGIVRIEVPNLTFAISQWQRAEWSDEALESRFSDASWGFANLFGWQRECDPLNGDYNQSYWDVHKSGYTADSLKYFLSGAGFEDIETSLASFTPEQLKRRGMHMSASDGCHLRATAKRPALSSRIAA